MTHEKVTRFEQAVIDRRLGRYVGFQCGSQPPVEPPMTTRVYAPPRLVPSTAYRRQPRIGGREVFAWALASVLALTNFAGAIAWVLR